MARVSPGLRREIIVPVADGVKLEIETFDPSRTRGR